jgi:hydroxyacylglutathione hydrolase
MPRSVLLAALLVTLTTPLSPVTPAAPAVIFPAWINGENCATEPKIQSFAYDANTYILRQSMCTDFEGPFIYLLFGQEKVLMVDSGASANPPIPLQQTVQRIINRWLSAHGQASIQLVVAHSHAHGDHIAGDGQFAGKPNTTVVGTSVSSVQTFFGITTWPTQIVTYELGGRTVDVIPIPGHETAHIAFYDRNTKLLLTGDTLYPGRLYISDFPTYVQSVQRLVDFTSVNQVSYVLGAHIEMSAVAGEDFPIGSTYHPNEHVLQLRRSHLLELLGGLLGMQGSPHIETHDDFVIYPL